MGFQMQGSDTYCKLNTSELAFYTNTHIEQYQFPKEKVTRVGECEMVCDQSPVLKDRSIRSLFKPGFCKCYLMVSRYVWNELDSAISV